MGSDFFHGFTHCEALLLRNARTYRCWLWTRVLGDRTSDLDSVGHRPPFSKLTLGGGTMVGKLLSISTRSGNCSTELILMTGLSMPLRIGSATGCGTDQLSPNSNRTRALPATEVSQQGHLTASTSRRQVNPHSWWNA